MPRDIFTVPELVEKIALITQREEAAYADVPDWNGAVMSWTDSAVLFRLSDGREAWFPLSHLRRADDARAILASRWSLRQRGLIVR